MKNNKEIVISIILILLLCFFAIIRPIQIIIVSGNSMNPTLHNGELLPFVRTTVINNNEIITFDSNKSWGDKKNPYYIKRAIGIPGDLIEIKEDSLFVNNKFILSFKNKIENKKGNFQYKLKEDEFFVMGDNVGYSFDSLYRLLNNEDIFTVKSEFINYKLLELN